MDHKKRQEIAERAFEVLLERGIQKTTMSHLAKALGMKRPTLYWYFPSLDSLFDTVTAGVEERLLQQVASAMAAASHPIDQLIAVLRTVTAYYETQQHTLRGLVQLWAVRQQSDSSIHQRVQIQRMFLTEVVRHGIAVGQVHPCDPEALVETVLTVVDGSVFRQVIAGTDPAVSTQFLIEHVLEPLRVPTPGDQE
jgi:TetR/AcrR family transcriptional regulator